MATATSPTPQFEPADPAIQRDPYPTYAHMRAVAPVQRVHRPGEPERAYCFRYEDVVEVLRSPQSETVQIADEVIGGLLEQPDSPFYSLARIVSTVMLVKDGDDHRRLRGLVSQAFTPRMVESLRPRVETIVDTLLVDAAPGHEMDLLTDFAAPLPIIVIAELLGMPPEDRVQLRHWSDRLATFIDGTIREAGLAAAAEAADAMCAYMEAIIEERRRAPKDDLISALVSAREEDDALSDDELLGTIGLILGAGHETTTNLIGNGVLALLQHPAQLAILREEPTRIGSAVEELLRYDSPVQTTSRIPSEDVELGGVKIPRGVEIGLYLGSANRDPEAFPQPDLLDVTREGARHLSFGHGVHFCLGAALARLEGQVALAALAERFPDLALASPELEWRSGIVLRGLVRLPVRL